MYKPNLIRRQLTVTVPAVLAIPALLDARTKSESLRPTPRQTEGPFYPRHLQGDLDNDLLVTGVRIYRAGQPAWVSGTVVDLRGQPLPGAVVEIWQCDVEERLKLTHCFHGILTHPVFA